MRELVLTPPPWYVAGAAIGLLVVGLLATLNERLAVLGAYGEVVDAVARRRSLGWKSFFLLGIVGGGLLHALLAGSWGSAEGYGWVTRTFGDGGALLVLLGAGVLIGYGAKTARGCTSGNGLTGCSLGSPASFAATMTFMATAIAATFATAALFEAP